VAKFTQVYMFTCSEDNACHVINGMISCSKGLQGVEDVSHIADSFRHVAHC